LADTCIYFAEKVVRTPECIACCQQNYNIFILSPYDGFLTTLSIAVSNSVSNGRMVVKGELEGRGAKQ